MRKIVPIIVFTLLIVYSGLVSSALPPPFLGAQDPRISPAERARIGDRVSASVKLVKISLAVPKKASLSVHTDAVGPILRIVVDGVEQLSAVTDVELNLSVDTVKEISIEVTGKAPTVESLREIKVLEVKMYVYYDEENEGTQTLVSLPLRISTQEITETVRSINTAKSKYDSAEELLDELEAEGKDVVALRTRLTEIKERIDIADESEAEGKISTAKTLADQAIRDLDRLITEANAFKPGPAPTDVKRYLTIAAAVIIMLLLVVLIRGRREELG